MELGDIFFIGKTLKELKFPEEWKYDFDMCRWKSEKFITRELNGEKNGYVYLSDEMVKIKSELKEEE